ncbi:MAG: PLDc N-terminal domain-containing protein [Planctomycetaceae bacterium]|nr:PLDc N-terminal domain-containing protein [Planctomycetales bacterium]MCB9924135.1 PLDc N-terminal domain-containing protein [Planctomycetaceae bacterium]
MFQLLAYTFQIGHGLLGLVIFVLDVVAIVGLLRGSASTVHKVLWIVLILFFPFVGVLLYYVIGRSPRDA